MKENLNRAMNGEVDDCLDLEATHHIHCSQTQDHRNATNGGDGAGDHARANATFLTGMRAKKTAGGCNRRTSCCYRLTLP